MEALVAVFFVALLSTGKPALEVEGWEVTGKPEGGLCTASYDHEPGEGQGRFVALAFVVVDGETFCSISVANAGWTFGERSRVEAKLLVDGNEVLAKQGWDAKDHGLTTTFKGGAGFLERLESGRKIVIRVEGASALNHVDASFPAPHLAVVVPAVRRCLGVEK